jgi:hypothetical protein
MGAAVAMLVLVVGSTAAAATPLVDLVHLYKIDPGEGWTSATAAPAGGAATAAAPAATAAQPGATRLLGSYRHAGGALLAIARIDYPNPAAWKDDKAFFAEVEAGLARDTAGYQKRAVKRRTLEGVPALDLTFRRRIDGGEETVAMRILFYRNYSLAATAAVSTRLWRKQHGAIERAIKSFAPARPL